MDNQKVFNTVATHLLTQKEKSMRMDGGCIGACAYRGVDGLECSIGCLLLDEDYDRDMEGLTLPDPYCVAEEGSLLLIAALKKSIRYEGGDDQRDLLNDLQSVHDDYPPRLWLRELSNVSRNRNLNDDCLNPFREVSK